MFNRRSYGPWGTWLALLLALLCQPVLALAQTTPATQMADNWQPLRILFLPETELPSAVASGSPRVLLTREEVADLLAEWRSQEERLRQAKIDDFRVLGPQGFGWERAEYVLTLSGESARLQGQVTGGSRDLQPVSLALPWRSGWVHQLTVNDQLPTWHLDERGQESLLLPPQARTVFGIDMTLAVATDSVRQSVSLSLPTVTVGRLSARVKGNVELIAGAAVLSRTYTDHDDTTTFELTAGHQSTELVFSLNNRQKQQALVWDSRALIHVELTRRMEHLEILLENRVIQGQLPYAAWDIPSDLVVSQVSGAGVRQWQVQPEENGQRLQIWLHPDQAQETIRVVAFRSRSEASEVSWEPPVIMALGAIQQPRMVDLLSTSDWVMTQVTTDRMDEVPVGVAAEILRQTPVTRVESFRRLGTWYGSDPAGQLQVTLRATMDRYAVSASHYVMVSTQGLDGRSVFVIENEGDLRFQIRLQTPAGFQIGSVADDQGPLPFRRIPQRQDGDPAVAEVEVTLRRGIGGSERILGIDRDAQGRGRSVNVTPGAVELIVSSRAVPEGWYANPSARSLILTPIQVRDAVIESGVLAVGVAPELAIQSVDSGAMVALGRQELMAANLASLDPNLAFDFTGTPGTVGLELGAKVPDLLVSSVTFYQLEPTRQRVNGELIIELRDGAQETFEIQLPLAAPPGVSFACMEPHAIRQQRRIGDLPGRWEVQLTGPATGRVHLTVSYDLPLDLNHEVPYEMEGLAVVAAPLQTRLVSIEGAEGIATQVEGDAEKWSLDRLPETRYQPGRRLLGLWELDDQQAALTLLVREQTLASTPMAVIESRTLESRLATDGTVLTFASYEIQSNVGALWLKLPPTARLWSLTHQGVPQTVPAAEGRLRIALPRDKDQSVHRVEFWYADSEGFDPVEEALMLSAPGWFTAAQSADEAEVPILQTQWRIAPPPGWVLRRPSSEWNHDVGDRSESWFPRNYRWLAQQSRAIQDLRRGWLTWTQKSTVQEMAAFAPANGLSPEFELEQAMREMLPNRAAADRADAVETPRKSAATGRPGARSPAAVPPPGNPVAEVSMAGSGAVGRNSDLGGMNGRAGMAGRDGQAGMGGGLVLRGGSDVRSEEVDAGAISGELYSFRDGADKVNLSESRPEEAELSQAVRAEKSGSGLAVDPQGRFVPPSNGSIAASSLSRRGYRSLTIPPDSEATAIVLTGLGNKSAVRLALLQGDRVDRWSWAVGLFGLALGLVLARWSARAWLLWVAFLLGLVAVAQWFHETQPMVALSLERLLWFALVLILWRLVSAIGRGLWASFGFKRDGDADPTPQPLGGGRAVTATTTVMVWWSLALFGGPSVFAQTPERRDITPLDLPEEAIVVFYDPARPTERLQGRWLVPRDWWERVRRETLTTPPLYPVPTRQLPARSQFALSVVGPQALELRGTLQVVVPETGPIYLPLDLGTGRLLVARIGQQDVTILDQTQEPLPAAVAIDAASDQQTGNDVRSIAPSPPLGLWIKLSEPGLQTIDLQVHYPLETRPGSWQASGRLPVSLATQLRLLQLPPASRIEWSTAVSVRSYAVPDTGELTELGVGHDGQFTVKWRAAADQARVGTSSMVHEAVVALREAGVEVRSDIRVTVADPTDELVLELPAAARLEAIQGPQLRGWSFTSAEHDRVLLQFLQPAIDLQFQTRLVGEQTYWSPTAVELEAPWPRLPDSGPMTGHVQILRSSTLRVNVLAAEGLRRSEAAATALNAGPWLSWNREVFGIVPYQTYQWQTASAKLKLQVERPQSQTEVVHRSIFQFDAKQAAFESQMTITPTIADLRSLVVRVPPQLNVNSLVCLGKLDGQDTTLPYQVTRRSREVEQDVEWELRLDQPQSEPVRLVWFGTLPCEIGQPFEWRPLQVLNATRETYEYALTKADNLELTAATWDAADAVLPSEFQVWLDARREAQLPLSLRSTTRDHRWTVVPQRVAAVVWFESVTDLTVADRVVEESLLLEWKIERSGINQVQFLLPALWRDCRIEGPWIGRVARTTQADGWVLFTVFLQDRIMGDYRLVATLDVPRTTRTDATATIPRALVGETRQQWITAQNTSQAEVEFFAEREVTTLQRQQRVFGELQSKIGAEYLANAFVVDTNATQPRLGWRTVTRSTLETRTAQIRLSETDLMLDRQGAYVARQRLQIKNRNQPTLQIQLPTDSQLVAVMVDGQSVQPWAIAGQPDGQITLPLLNSSVLNLDYPVEFLYRGQLPTVGTWESIGLPLAFPKNIEAEVSHLRLHLPPELRPILFAGTMSRVNSSGELLAEVEDYQSKVLAEFKQGVVGGFVSKANRSRQIRELEAYLDDNRLRVDSNVNSRLSQEVQELDRALQQEEPAPESVFSNRSKLRGLVVEQFNSNEEDVNPGYFNNFVNPEMGQGQFGRDLSQSPGQQGPTRRGGEQAAVSRGNANQRLADTLQADESLQRQWVGKGGRDGKDEAKQTSEQLAAQSGRRPGVDLGLAPSLPPVVNAPWGPESTTGPLAKRVTGLRLDFQPQGEVYYFRVPRGRPELTATLTTQNLWFRSISSLELLAALVVAVLLAAVLRRRT